jgi:hypothetical protein
MTPPNVSVKGLSERMSDKNGEWLHPAVDFAKDVAQLEQQLAAAQAELARVRLEEAEWWARKSGHRGPVIPELLDKSCEMCVRIITLRAALASAPEGEAATDSLKSEQAINTSARRIE